MRWLRLYNETVTDPKWRMVAVETGQPVHAVLAVWMAMLCHASAAEPRGTLAGWNDRLAGAALDLKGAAVETIRTAMQGVVLDGDRLTAWEKRQFKGDDVNERVKRYRSKKSAQAGNCNVTSAENGDGNGAVTLQTTDETLPPLRATDSRSQTLDADDTRERISTVGREVLRLIGVADDPRWLGDWGRVAQWLADGYDPDLDIYPTIRRVMDRRKGQGPPHSLQYFDDAVRTAHTKRNRPMPEGKQPYEQRRQPAQRARNGFVAVALEEADRRNRDPFGNPGRWDGPSLDLEPAGIGTD